MQRGVHQAQQAGRQQYICTYVVAPGGAAGSSSHMAPGRKPEGCHCHCCCCWSHSGKIQHKHSGPSLTSNSHEIRRLHRNKHPHPELPYKEPEIPAKSQCFQRIDALGQDLSGTTRGRTPPNPHSGVSQILFLHSPSTRRRRTSSSTAYERPICWGDCTITKRGRQQV
jgi:hypothetical protein